jgi:hypothetical protein
MQRSREDLYKRIAERLQLAKDLDIARLVKTYYYMQNKPDEQIIVDKLNGYDLFYVTDVHTNTSLCEVIADDGVTFFVPGEWVTRLQKFVNKKDEMELEYEYERWEFT